MPAPPGCSPTWDSKRRHTSAGTGLFPGKPDGEGASPVEETRENARIILYGNTSARGADLEQWIW